MKVRKNMVVKAIDSILTEHAKQQANYDKALVSWERERRAIWIRDQRPKFKQLQLAVSASGNTKVITDEMIRACGFKAGKYGGYELGAFVENQIAPPTLNFEDGRKVSAPTGVNVDQLTATKALLAAVVDDVVSDSTLTKLGGKDLATIFQRAVEMGGLVA